VDEPVVDERATRLLRESLRAARPEAQPFFDRGPGYRELAGGPATADVDWL
jgi:N-methylhydantoinase B